MTTDKKVDPYLLTDVSIQEPPKSLLKALAQIGPGIILAGSIIGSALEWPLWRPGPESGGLIRNW